jgi:hypothetical protein
LELLRVDDGVDRLIEAEVVLREIMAFIAVRLDQGANLVGIHERCGARATEREVVGQHDSTGGMMVAKDDLVGGEACDGTDLGDAAELHNVSPVWSC